MKFLSVGPAVVRRASKEGAVLLESDGRGSIAAGRTQLTAMANAGLLERAGGALRLSEAGTAALKRAAAARDPFREQHGDTVQQGFDTPEGRIVAEVNLSESPLGQLARRKAKDGKPFLAEAEWEAGERLRSDYTRARLMPRLGPNWQAVVASGGRRKGNAGGVAELTDAALAARQRVERAIDAVGPELAGVLIDVCCFLKGLETVELERGWPARSAKIMLKSALAALSRHYGRSSSPRAPRLLHWGADDYRPVLNAVAME